MQIKTYKGKQIEKPYFIFILNKGNNSGKPLMQPCANCYILTTDTKEEKDFYYWLCYGLWQSNKFHPYLCGSVIPFIRVHDVRSIINQAEQKIKSKRGKFNKALKTLIKVNEHYDDITVQLKLLKQVKGLILKGLI